MLFGILFISVLPSENVNAGDRKVLTERFTSSTCVPCRIYNPTLENFLNTTDPEKVTNISYHMNWPAPGNDPMYHINVADNSARRTLYGVNSIPDWFFDGARVQPDGGVGPLQAAFNQRTNLLSPVTIIVTDVFNGTNVTVKAEVHCEGLIANPNVTIQFAVIEKIVYYNGTNGETNYTYVMRKLLNSPDGTRVTLLPGNKVSIEYSYVMDPVWNPALIYNMVFVQENTREILNCAMPTTNFNLVSSPGFKYVELGQSGNATFNLKIPSVASGFNSPVTFTYEVSPANAGISAAFPGGNIISNFPDSLNASVSSTAGVPAGEYKIIFTGTSASGKIHKTYVNYLVGKNYYTVSNSRPQLLFKVDNVSYSGPRAFSWDINSTHTLEATSPQTFGNNRYVFNNWSNGGTQIQTITAGTSVSSYTPFYKAQYRLLGQVLPTGLPVTISNSGSFLDSASTNNITVSAQQVQHNGKTYYFNRWEGTGSGSYTGTNSVAPITMNGFILQKAIYDTIDVGISNYNSLIPDKFALYQNYPNPFNPVTNIKFDIARTSMAFLIIFDMLGKEVVTLVNQNLAPGSYQYSFNASNFPSGIYYYKVKTAEFTEIKKMILLK